MDNIVLEWYQQRVVDFFKNEKNKKIFIYHSTGSGKTITAVASTDTILKHHPNKRLVIITSASTLKQWDLATSHILNKNIISHQHISKHVDFLLKTRNCILIIDEFHILRKKMGEKSEYNIQFINQMQELYLPEGKHLDIKRKINGIIKAGRSSKVKVHLDSSWFYQKIPVIVWYNYLASNLASHVILMTASPVVNESDDIKNMCRFLSDNDWSGGEECLKEINISYYDRFDCPEGLLNFPEVVTTNIILTLKEDERQEYEDIEHGTLLIDPTKKWANVAQKQNYMIKMNQMRQVTNDAFDPKIFFITEMMKNSIKPLKFFIYTNWVAHGVNILKKNITEETFIIKGGMSTTNITDVINKFNEPLKNKHRVIIITSAGREGLNLKGVNIVFLLESSWNHALEQQAIARAVRYKSHSHLPPAERNVHVFRLIIDDSADSTLLTRFIEPKEAIEQYWRNLFKVNSI